VPSPLWGSRTEWVPAVTRSGVVRRTEPVQNGVHEMAFHR